MSIMVLDDEVMKMGGLGLDRRICGLSKSTLIQIAQNEQGSVSALLSEEISGLSVIHEVRSQ